MTCPDCTQARAGQWIGYRADCQDCTARAVARSLPAFNALDPRGTGERDELRDLIRQAMPNTVAADARRMVWAWWQHDQAQAATTTTARATA